MLEQYSPAEMQALDHRDRTGTGGKVATPRPLGPRDQGRGPRRSGSVEHGIFLDEEGIQLYERAQNISGSDFVSAVLVSGDMRRK